MTTTRASVDGAQQQGDDFSQTLGSGSQISADGRYVVFESGASNLVAGDTNGRQDIFVKDLTDGTVTRVSTAADGTEAGGASSGATISADGRYVAFMSEADNLVSGDANGTADIFVKDLRTNAITRVNTALGGTSDSVGSSFNAVISADGAHVVFASEASDLVADDTNGLQDVFVRNLTTGIVTRVSTDARGTQSDGTSGGFGVGDSPAISADGRYVVFSSEATNLVSDDTNGVQDVFVKDLIGGTLTRVSVAGDGSQADGGSLGATISADGLRVAFASTATNLVSGDTNGFADVFVRDLVAGTTTLVSADGNRAGGDGDSFGASISADGTRVAYASNATNLVAGDTNGQTDIFVRDLTGGATYRVSTREDGTESGGGPNFNASISGDGSRVVYSSLSGDLVTGDTNSRPDVFVSDAVCFAGGTAIRILRAGPAGDIAIDAAVEDLAVGDRAVTADGGTRPIRWIGHRTLDLTRHPEPGRVGPVRIAAHAFGAGRPARDLTVSPGHGLCLDLLGEVLIPAGRLVNGTTITRIAPERVTYWHVELDRHDILIAEGLPAESYLDCGNRRFFANADAIDPASVPDAPSEGPLPFCRPLHETGPLVDLVRARLRERAEALGWHRVEDIVAGLHLVADGAVLRPDIAGPTARFVLSADARDVRLVSGVGVPAHVLSGSTDERRLGVPLAGLAIDDGLTGPRTVAPDDPRLAQGFHPFEPDAVCRWTDGAAVLPAALWAGCRGTLFLRVTLAGPALPRWVGPGARAQESDEARQRA